MLDREAHGTCPKGEQVANAKLSEQSVLAIVRLYDEGIPQDVIGRAFGVAQGTVSSIIVGKHWRHLARPEAASAWKEPNQ